MIPGISSGLWTILEITGTDFDNAACAVLRKTGELNQRLSERYPIQVVLKEDVPIHYNVFAQYRYPRSKKRRIREKWAHRTENYKHHQVYVIFVPREGNQVIMHPKTWEEFGVQLWPESANQTSTLPTLPSIESPSESGG